MRIVVSLLVFLFSCSFSGKHIKKSKDIIYWSENVKLTWDDFKGDVKKLPKGKGAISNIGIDYSAFTGYYDVTASFNKRKSIKSKRFISDYALKHEQYHFNIAELFVRRFRKRIRQEPIEVEENLLVEIFQAMQSNHKTYQDLYDKETGHSTIEEKQKKWEEKVDKELAELEEFASK